MVVLLLFLTTLGLGALLGLIFRSQLGRSTEKELPQLYDTDLTPEAITKPEKGQLVQQYLLPQVESETEEFDEEEEEEEEEEPDEEESSEEGEDDWKRISFVPRVRFSLENVEETGRSLLFITDSSDDHGWRGVSSNPAGLQEDPYDFPVAEKMSPPQGSVLVD